METEARIEKYATTTVAQTAAENLVELMHDEFYEKYHSIYDSEVRYNIQVSTNGREVHVCVNHYGVRSIFSFVRDNLQPPEFPTEFTCAVCFLAVDLAVEMYKARHPRDISGFSYSLTFKACTSRAFDITYTAPNGFYTPPRAGDPLNCGIADLPASP